MAFEGYRMTDKPGSRLLDQNGQFYETAWINHPKVGVTVVSGSGPNFAGHALLRVKTYTTARTGDDVTDDGRGDLRKDGRSSYYHVPQPGRTTPLYLDGKPDLNKYLTDEGKTVIGTCWFPASKGNPAALLNLLLQYAHGQKKYTWMVTHHNCWSFATQTAKEAGYLTPSFGAVCPKTPIQLLQRLANDGTWKGLVAMAS